jgi:3D (Asp-Asp-Asp) domain-containing protein
MKKFSSSTQMFSENLKKYLKRASIVVVTTSLGVASLVTISTDETKVYSDVKMMSVAQAGATSIEDTKVEYSKVEYSDLQESVSAYEQMAKVEKSGQTATSVALAKKKEESKAKSVSTEDETTEAVQLADQSTEAKTEEVTPSTEAATEKSTEAELEDEAVLAVQSSTTETKKKSSDNEKQQLGIEVADDTEAATVGAILVEDDSYSSGTYLGTYVTTAYCGCSSCCGKSDGITASGTYATQGRTIAAPSTFAFGTELIIDGNTYVVEDRGGSINGNRLDIYFDSHQAALNYGRKTVDVYVK